MVNLERQLKFPQHIATTILRPDVVLVSNSTRKLLLLEFTVPWEDLLEEAFEWKLTNYGCLNLREVAAEQGAYQWRLSAGALLPFIQSP